MNSLWQFLEHHDAIFFLLGSIFLIILAIAIIVVLNHFLPARVHTQHYQPEKDIEG